jgi:hypothetical protein
MFIKVVTIIMIAAIVIIMKEPGYLSLCID